MKPVLLSIIIFFLALRLSAQSFIDRIAEQSCECIAAVSRGGDPEQDPESLTTACVNKAIMDHTGAIAKAYEVDLRDQVIAGAIGEEVGAQLGSILADNCRAFQNLMVVSKAPYAEEIYGSEKMHHEAEGVFMEEKSGPLSYVIIEDEYGDRRSFLLLRPFEGCDKLVGQLSMGKGKRIKIIWRSAQIFEPESRKFKKVKEIVGISFL